MRILIVTYAYWPSLNPRAFRWTALAEHWASQGHVVDVLCEAALGRPRQEDVRGVNVYRAGRLAASGAGGKIAPTAQRSWLRSAARRLWRSLYWPDYACRWYPSAQRKVRELLVENDYDLLISSSVPFTGHLVGLAAKRFRPDLKWLVDIGDPFSFADGAPANNFHLFKYLNRSVERRILHNADVVSVTTQGTMDRYAQLFPVEAGKITVIPPLLTNKLSPPESLAELDGKLKLVFLGTLYGDIRNPAPLLASFNDLLATSLGTRIELHFYGDSTDAARSFEPYLHLIGTKIFLHGLVSKQEAVGAMEQATVLVNIGNNSPYQIPSKVIEYAASYKPIINFSTSPNDSSSIFFRDFDNVIDINYYESCRGSRTTELLCEFLLKKPVFHVEQRESTLSQYMIDRVSNDYLDA